MCAADGSAWSDCQCTVDSVKLGPQTTLVRTRAQDGAVVEGRKLVLPLRGNEALLKLAPGAILTSFDGRGFLGRISSLKQENGTIAFDTTIPSLREAFDELGIHVDSELDVVSAMPEAARNAVDVQKVGISAGKYGFSLGVAGDLDFGVDVLEGSSFSFRPRTKVDLSIGLFSGVKFGMSSGVNLDLDLRTKLHAALHGSVTAEVDVIQMAIALATQIDEPLLVPVGPGVVMTVSLIYGCELGLDGEIDLETRFTANAAAHGGFDCKMPWGKSPSCTKKANDDFNGSATIESGDHKVETSLECYARPQIGLMLFDIAGPYVTAGPYANTTVTIGPKNEVDLSLGFKGMVGGKVEIPEINVTLWEKDWTLFDFNKSLYSYEWAICGDGYQQLDEGCDIGPYLANDPRIPNPPPCVPPGQPNACTCAPGYIQAPFGSTIDNKWGSRGNYCIPACGNGQIDPGEACDDGLGVNGNCGKCTLDCKRQMGVCGDNVVDRDCGEVCDDGNTNSCDGCNSICSFDDTLCGDGIPSYNCGQPCDDGNDNPNDGCDACRIPQCGDGIKTTNEQCDDGNRDDCDGCHNDCTTNLNTCGDGHTCGAEQCDRAGEVWDCDVDCTTNTCGDGHKGVGEQCDDGRNTVTCDVDCTPPRCGDGVVNEATGEECDDRGDSWRCDADCTWKVCGDGSKNQQAACDDGDTDQCTPGCNSVCTGPGINAVCGDGVVQCNEGCDDGALNGSCGKCNTSCTRRVGVCGDGVKDASCGEVCDDRNTQSGDGCRWDCKSTEQCGDGYPDPNEACDDGNTASCGGTCKSDCSGLYPDRCGDGVVTACEVCDDSDPTNHSVDRGCSAAAPNCAGCGRCSADVCGDGIVGASEQCEPVGVCGDTTEHSCTLLDKSQCLPGPACNLFADDHCTVSCTRP